MNKTPCDVFSQRWEMRFEKHLIPMYFKTNSKWFSDTFKGPHYQRMPRNWISYNHFYGQKDQYFCPSNMSNEFSFESVGFFYLGLDLTIYGTKMRFLGHLIISNWIKIWKMLVHEFYWLFYVIRRKLHAFSIQKQES